MKFSLERDSFAKILKRIEAVSSTRGSFAICSFCMIEAVDSQIIVTSTDLDTTLRIVEPANVQENGIIVINAKRFSDTVAYLTKGCEVCISSEGSQIRVNAGNFNAMIPSGDISEYPKIQPIEIKSSLAIDASRFKTLIDKTIFSISNDDSRTEFTGALLRIFEDGRVEMVSTDGHRLSRAASTMNSVGSVPAAFTEGVILSKKGLAELSKNLTEGNVRIDICGSKAIIASDSMTFYLTLLPGHFPDFSKVISSQLDHKAVIRRDSFQQILKRASIFASKTGTIRLSLSSGMIQISTFDVKSGEMRDFIDAEYDGIGVEIGFNWHYVDEILSVIDGEYVSLEVMDTDSPALIRDVETEQFDFIVMPMQL